MSVSRWWRTGSRCSTVQHVESLGYWVCGARVSPSYIAVLHCCPPPNRHADPSFLTSSTSSLFIIVAPLKNSFKTESVSVSYRMVLRARIPAIARRSLGLRILDMSQVNVSYARAPLTDRADFNVTNLSSQPTEPTQIRRTRCCNYHEAVRCNYIYHGCNYVSGHRGGSCLL